MLAHRRNSPLNECFKQTLGYSLVLICQNDPPLLILRLLKPLLCGLYCWAEQRIFRYNKIRLESPCPFQNKKQNITTNPSLLANEGPPKMRSVFYYLAKQKCTHAYGCDLALSGQTRKRCSSQSGSTKPCYKITVHATIVCRTLPTLTSVGMRYTEIRLREKHSLL